MFTKVCFVLAMLCLVAFSMAFFLPFGILSGIVLIPLFILFMIPVGLKVLSTLLHRGKGGGESGPAEEYTMTGRKIN